MKKVKNIVYPNDVRYRYVPRTLLQSMSEILHPMTERVWLVSFPIYTQQLKLYFHVGKT